MRRQVIEPGVVCVLWKGTEMARVVVVTRRAFSHVSGEGDWYTRPYLDRGYPEKRVNEIELTLIVNEMEVLAWASSD